jgi:hypothetical protein
VSATELATGVLATYRLTRLITTDVITEPIRERIWDRFPPNTPKPALSPGYLVSCDFCSSVYAGAAVAVLTHVARTNTPARLLLGTLAFSGAVSLYHDSRENS